MHRAEDATGISVQEQFGQIDIYLFDQLLKGRISPGMRILDAGFGSGRNIAYFLREGYEVCGVDSDAEAVESVRSLARMFAPALPASNFRAGVGRENAFRGSALRSGGQQRRPPFRPRRCAIRVDAEGIVAGVETRRALLLPTRILDRH